MGTLEQDSGGTVTLVDYIQIDGMPRPVAFGVGHANLGGNSFTYSLDLPAGSMSGATIDANGAFSWTPDADDVGHTYTFGITATNENSESVTQTYGIAVTPFVESATIVKINNEIGDICRLVDPNYIDANDALSLSPPQNLDGSLSVDTGISILPCRPGQSASGISILPYTWDETSSFNPADFWLPCTVGKTPVVDPASLLCNAAKPGTPVGLDGSLGMEAW
jgi:hypothetical protein